MAINVINANNVINAKPELNVASIFSIYRYPFSALLLMQKGCFPKQTNDIILTSNPPTPTVYLCRNFTINSGATYTLPYICVTATNSITINGIIDVNTQSTVVSSFFLNKNLPLHIHEAPNTYNDIPSGGATGNSSALGFGGGNGGNVANSGYVNPSFYYRVLYNNFYQETQHIKQTALSVQKAGGYISGRRTSSTSAGGIVVLCAPTIIVNGNILAYGRDDTQTSSHAYGSGGGVIYLVGNTITIGSVSINAKGGNAAITSSNYIAHGGGGGFVVIAGTKSITNNATINVSGGIASGGADRHIGQNGSLIITTFNFDLVYTGNF